MTKAYVSITAFLFKNRAPSPAKLWRRRYYLTDSLTVFGSITELYYHMKKLCISISFKVLRKIWCLASCICKKYVYKYSYYDALVLLFRKLLRSWKKKKKEWNYSSSFVLVSRHLYLIAQWMINKSVYQISM